MVSTIKEINKMKTIQLKQFAYNITEGDTAIEATRINIKLKAPSVYSMQQYTQDYLDVALLTPWKSFKQEVSLFRTKWMLGGDVILNIDYMRDNINQRYRTLNTMIPEKSRSQNQVKLLLQQLR